MADFGLRVVNSSGYVQIDSTYKNLALRESGTVVSGGSSTGNTGWYAATPTTVAGTCPVIAFRASNTCFMRYSVVSGNQITYYFFCQGAGVSVQYWIFDDPAAATPSGSYGLIVKDGAGAKVFDSRLTYMRVIDALSGAASSAADDPWTNGFSRSYSGVPAVVQGQLFSEVLNAIVSTPPNFTVTASWIAGAVSFSGGAVTWKSVNPNTVQSQTSVAPTNQQHSNYDYLVLDVSNM